MAGRRALAWIAAHRAAFAPPRDAPTPSQLVVFGELGLLVHLLRREHNGASRENGRRRDQSHVSDLEKCGAALSSAYDEASFLCTLAQDRSAVLHAWLTVLLGLGDSKTAVAAKQIAADDPNAFAHERLPHRTLELCWLVDALGWHSPFAPADAHVYPTTFLGRPHDIARASPADAYAVTHTIAYLTDFGRRPFLESGRERAISDTLQLLRRALDWEHYDLVAELLAALGWLGVKANAAQYTGWERVTACQLRSGAVLAIPAEPELLAEIEASEDLSFFGLLYHTTLVTALAASAFAFANR